MSRDDGRPAGDGSASVTRTSSSTEKSAAARDGPAPAGDGASEKDIKELTPREIENAGDAPAAATQILAGKKMFVVMVVLALSMFLAALDNTIVSTMLPKITQKFEALSLMTWIISSYLIAGTALQPLYGKLCNIYGHQYVLLAAHAFFLAGSVVCGASTSAHMLIAGRTIAGLGGSGLMSICFVVVGDFVPTARGPMYISVFSMMWALASVAGPLLGGVFADKTGFEWGFYINPCIQALVIVLIVLYMRVPRPRGSALEKLRRVDFVGIPFLVGGIVLLQLALTWGGHDHPWKSAAVIVPLVLSIVLLGAFVLIEWKVPTEPIMPLRLFQRRNTALMFAAQVTFGMVFFVPIFYIPLYLSVVRNASAINSGLHLISCMLGISLTSVVAGVVITKTGIFRPFIWAGTAMTTAGLGLFVLMGSHPSNGILIGIPIVFGVGIGMSMQPMISCAQNSVEQKDIATTTTLFMTIRMLGAAIGLAIAQSVIQNAISPRLHSLAARFPDYADAVYGVTTDQAVIWKPSVPADVRDAVIDAYVHALHRAYLVLLAFGGLTFVMSLFVKNVSLRKRLGGAAVD